MGRRIDQTQVTVKTKAQRRGREAESLKQGCRWSHEAHLTGGRLGLDPRRCSGTPHPGPWTGICPETGNGINSSDQNNRSGLGLLNVQQPTTSCYSVPAPPSQETALASRAHSSVVIRARRGSRELSWRAQLPPPCDRQGPRKSHRRSSFPRMQQRSRSSSWSGS